MSEWRKITARCTTKLMHVAVPCATTNARVIRHAEPGSSASITAFIPTWTANVMPYSTNTDASCTPPPAARNVHRRLIRYAVRVPSTKASALARWIHIPVASIA